MKEEKNLKEAQERAKKIKIFVHDIHGVLTTDSVYCDQEGQRRYEFWHMDGFGDLSLSANGIIPVFLDSTSIDEEGLHRAKELKLDKYYYKVTPLEKMAKFEEIKKGFGVEDQEVGYLGYEIMDIPFMKKVGFPVATSDAADEVKDLAVYVTSSPGGRGAMREVCEFVLRSKGLWDEWVEKVTKMGYK
ncbi:MAG: hypothetical protein N2513_05820 [Deltaproteobacteria bacterium]|nr:hypothetical protein [Deltaproteobacteria bacterium]